GLVHGVIVTSDGSVWAWGSNDNGRLGDGTEDTRVVPVQIAEANFAWKTSTPRITSPYGGTWSYVQTPTLSAVTTGPAIHYSTNGVDPTQDDPTVMSGYTVTIDQSVTLNAKAWASGMPASNVASATFTMNLPNPSISVTAGTYVSAPVTGTYVSTGTVGIAM